MQSSECAPSSGMQCTQYHYLYHHNNVGKKYYCYYHLYYCWKGRCSPQGAHLALVELY